MKKYIISIDQGTSSSRCIIFDVTGCVISQHQLEHRQIFPKNGWVEHNPLEIWENIKTVISTSISNANIKTSEISAIGITNQRETTVVWDRLTGKPYYNAIVWQDTRTDSLCTLLGGKKGIDRYRHKTGLPLTTYFSAPKLRWILDNVEPVRESALEGIAIFGTMDSWLIWNLTGGTQGGIHITDVTNASRTLLMDLETLTWSTEITQAMNIPLKMLPKICPSSQIYGYTSADSPFCSGIPIAGILGDQQAAMVGQTCFEPGNIKNTYGTGCFMLINTGKKIIHSQSGLLTTVCYQFGNNPAVYALEGSIAIAGALVQWLRDNLGLIGDTATIEACAREVADNGDVYFVPAFSGLFAPYWRKDARGIIVGLSQFTKKGHICRAALEATAFQTRELYDAMLEDLTNNNIKASINSLKVDGGMVHNNLLMQFQADVLGIPILRSKISEATALGAAYAAGLAIGFWKNEESLLRNWDSDKSWQPIENDRARTTLFYRWKKAVKKSFDWKL